MQMKIIIACHKSKANRVMRALWRTCSTFTLLQFLQGKMGGFLWAWQGSFPDEINEHFACK